MAEIKKSQKARKSQYEKLHGPQRLDFQTSMHSCILKQLWNNECYKNHEGQQENN